MNYLCFLSKNVNLYFTGLVQYKHGWDKRTMLDSLFMLIYNKVVILADFFLYYGNSRRRTWDFLLLQSKDNAFIPHL